MLYFGKIATLRCQQLQIIELATLLLNPKLVADLSA